MLIITTSTITTATTTTVRTVLEAFRFQAVCVSMLLVGISPNFQSNSVQLGTKMNWLDFDVKRSEFKLTVIPDTLFR